MKFLDFQSSGPTSKINDVFPASFDCRNQIPPVREKKKKTTTTQLKYIIPKRTL